MNKQKGLLLIFCLLTALPAWADQFTGTVVRVIDGDTVEVLDADQTAHRVRLAGIGTPERGQAFGTRAKQGFLAQTANNMQYDFVGLSASSARTVVIIANS